MSWSPPPEKTQNFKKITLSLNAPSIKIPPPLVPLTLPKGIETPGEPIISNLSLLNAERASARSYVGVTKKEEEEGLAPKPLSRFKKAPSPARKITPVVETQERKKK